MSRRALVTGGSGYFGRVLVAALRARAHDVTVLDRVEPDETLGVRFVRADIRDASVVERACEGVDVVYHAVAEVPIAKDAAVFESVNVGGARSILGGALARGVRKVVLVSSSAVFGVPSRNPVDATTEPRPREAYGTAKLGAERVAADYTRRGLDVTIVRPRTILGHDRLGVFQILFELVRKGRPIYVLGRGDNRYQFIHADDLADACIRAGEHAGPATFNVGAERFGTMRECLEALVRHAGTGSPVRSLPRRPAEALMRLTSLLRISPLGPYHSLMYGREIYFDVTPAKATLGWRSTRSNEEMMVESYDRYLAQREGILGRRGASRHRSPVPFGVLRLLELLP